MRYSALSGIGKGQVQVLDALSQVIETVHPAVARYAVRQGFAKVLAFDPYCVQLMEGLDHCPRPTGIDTVVVKERNSMAISKTPTLNRAQVIAAVQKFFDAVALDDGLVWVKVVAPKGNQVVLEFGKSPSGEVYRIRQAEGGNALKPGDPICLSESVPLHVIRECGDLKRAVSAQPPLLKLMTTAEADAFFEKKAGILKTDAQDLKKAAMTREGDLGNFGQVASDASVDTKQAISTAYVDAQEVVNDRVIYLCAQVSAQLDEEQRWDVKKFMSELLDLEDSLTLDDWTYIQALGFYPSIRNEATKRLAAISQSMAPETDALS